MKTIQILIVSLLSFKNSYSQDLVSTDTGNCNQTITFHKVKKSFKEAKTALMKLDYKKGNQKGFIKFEIPSFIFRLKTTLSDYCVIETKTKKIKLQNTVEKATENFNFIGYYDFTFFLSTDSLQNILTDEVKKVTFYFTPNPDIKKYLNENKLVNKEYDRLMKRNSKKTIIYTISKPDIKQYKEVLSCINKL